MSDLHPVFREITQSFFLTPPPDSGSRVDPHAAVIDALPATGTADLQQHTHTTPAGEAK